MRIFPEMCPRMTCPFSSLTRKVALGRVSTISPCIWITSSFAMFVTVVFPSKRGISKRRAPALLDAFLSDDQDKRQNHTEKFSPCNGQAGRQRMGGVRLASIDGATADRGGRVARAPGLPQSTAIYKNISAADKSRRMPP